ncbi:MAG: insulinase family protein [Clostridia bacterium]|nr:insulinase family protein [Clostridia bacterium]
MSENYEIREKYSPDIDEKYYYIKHKSGLDIYFIPKKMTTAYALITTKYGAVDNRFRLRGEREWTEVPDGIAHFLEHKMFENEDGEDTFEKYARYGGNANAFTASQSTSYLVSCTDNFDENLRILLDLVSSPYFTPENVSKEQGIIGQEIQMGIDNPGRALYYNLLEAMYAESQIKINVAGSIDSISKITADLLYSCYYTFYNLSNMVLVVSGDVSLDGILDAADDILPNLEPNEIIRYYNEEEPEVAKARITGERDVSKPLFRIGIKDVDIPKDGDERMRKQIAVSLLYQVMFGPTSDFAINLFESGLVNGFGAGYGLGDMSAYGSLGGESDDPEKVFSLFLDRVKDAVDNGIPEEEFNIVKRAAYASYVRSFDSTSEIADSFTFTYLDGGDYFDYGKMLTDVDFDEVSSYIEKIFKPEYYAMSVINPKKGE